MTKRAAAPVALLLGLVGCGGLPPEGGRVPLLAGPPAQSSGCFTNAAAGRLVVDPSYGTAIIDSDVHSTVPVTVAWRPGFTARRIGSQVQVLDPGGNAVAITGRSYRIPGGYVSAGGSSGLDWPGLPTDVFWACDAVTPLP